MLTGAESCGAAAEGKSGFLNRSLRHNQNETSDLVSLLIILRCILSTIRRFSGYLPRPLGDSERDWTVLIIYVGGGRSALQEAGRLSLVPDRSGWPVATEDN